MRRKQTLGTKPNTWFLVTLKQSTPDISENIKIRLFYENRNGEGKN